MHGSRRPPKQVTPGRGKAGGHGQEPFIPTDRQRHEVMKFVACGFTAESISVITNIPYGTLMDHFPFELREGKTVVDAKILGGIVEAALEGDKTMRIFYARSRAGWNQYGPAVDSSAASTFSISIGGGPSESAAEIKVSVLPQPPTIEGEAEEP